MNIRALPKRSSGVVEKTFPVGFDSLFSDGSADFVFPPGPHKPGAEVEIKMRGLIGVEVKDVQLRILPDGEERLLKMAPKNHSPFTYWSATVKINRCPFQYRFRIQTDRQVLWLNASGIHKGMPPDDEDFMLVPGFDGPDWPRQSVFYQIFPDRFKCGRPEVSLAQREISPSISRVILKNWSEPLSKPAEGRDFFGGDLWGITDSLEYLEKLGVNAIYLNPIFASPSNHKYDTIDYRRVDPFLGGDEAFTALSRAAGKKGIKVILDGVFNHAGYHHPWFQDALKNRKSQYREMFSFESGNTYVSWLNHSSLPKWNYSSGKLREEMFRGRDSIAKLWLRKPFDADGWRLDAPNMLGCDGTDADNIEIWREFRKEVKKEKRQSYLFGECFFEGTRWLRGDTFDAIMNYKGFTIPMIQWLTGGDLHFFPAEITAENAMQWMIAMMARIPFEIRNLQYNPLSTHDIARFIHRVSGNVKLYKVAAAIQIAFPGVPALYYGEELCLDGAKDPDNRRPMPWNSVGEHEDTIQYLSRLIGLKKSMKCLQEGAFSFLVADTDAMSFARFLGEEVLIVAANRSEFPRRLSIPVSILGLPERSQLRSVLGMDSLKEVTGGTVKLTLGPREAVWLVPA